MNDSHVIVSLDFSDPGHALKLIGKMDPAHCRLKIGKELFTRAGPVFVNQVIEKGYSVFLDLKFHDIPTTVAKACSAAADMGVWMLNLHASGGLRMMTMAREAIDKHLHKPLLIAVTVLTSMNERDLKQIGVVKHVSEQVKDLAMLANKSGLDGVVCSAREVAMLRKEFGDGFCLVTPGIRLQGSEHHDQQRVMTPAEAIRAGSDYLVIGRPVTQAADPLKALMAIEKEIARVKREA
ncbi:MAG: orotidine-5'-phosphate decarboxylase [Gammaproteobacteria bacterium]|nr:orotidine-5'-phosphate decarboxylase [Gammaproteobacteria bacterium]